MSAERYVVLGLARARSPWFAEVARWSTSALVPVEFLKCLSPEELRARLRSGRTFSAVLVDAGAPGVDRDLLAAATDAGCAVLVVDDGRAPRDWAALGASATLPAGFGPDELVDALAARATPVGRWEAATPPPTPPAAATDGTWRGELVAVTGAGGAGTSTAACALAQGLAADCRNSGMVVLADLALDADLAVLHDAGDVVPGVQELVEAHRGGTPPVEDVRALTWAVPTRGYSLLLGLRRHRDWAALRPRAVEAALDGLRRAYRLVVCDVEPDVEGEAQCGSVDVEDRNALARTAVRQASLVVVVGVPGVQGVHDLVRVVDGLLELGVPADRLLPVVNRAPRSARARAEITAAVAELVGRLAPGAALPSPIFLPERRRLDAVVWDVQQLPSPLVAPLTAAVTGLLAGRRAPAVQPPEPVPVAPGTLGAWTDDGDGDADAG